MRHDDADQLGGHLVDVKRAADSPHRAVHHDLPHDRRVEEPLLHRRRDAHDDLRGQLGVSRADRLDGDDCVGDRAVGGAERQHGGALAVGARAVDERLENLGRWPVGCSEQRRQLGSDQLARLGGQHVTGTAVVLADLACLVDPENQRPGRGIGQHR